MIKYFNLRSTAKEVKPIEIDEYSVYVNRNVKKSSEEDFEGFEIGEQTIYTKNEYIELLNNENETMRETISTILTDIIPNI